MPGCTQITLGWKKIVPLNSPAQGDQEVDMKRWFTAAVLAAIIAALSPSVFAQWPLHPQGVPQGPDGKPNLNGPAPRTADGKPDLSGVYIRYDAAESDGPPADRAPLVNRGNARAGFNDGLPAKPGAA